MKQKGFTLLLLLGCVVFGIAGFMIYTKHDRVAPEIKVEEKEISYTKGESYDILLEGVTASDDVDGDVTDKVFVDQIVDMGTGEAVVYYGVMDSSNNVGTGKRIVKYSESKSKKSEKKDTKKTKKDTEKKEDSAETKKSDTQKKENQ